MLLPFDARMGFSSTLTLDICTAGYEDPSRPFSVAPVLLGMVGGSVEVVVTVDPRLGFGNGA